jgi:ribosome maturation factor RimP
MGSTAHFFFRFFLDSCHRPLNLVEILERTLPAMGYELVDWESAARGGLVRVFIDKPAGIDVEDCARVSNHLTHLFAVEQVAYERLEVSSPGLDRPLKKSGDFARFAGEQVKLTLRASVDNAKRIKGILRGVEGDCVLIDTETGRRTIALANIDKARLVPRIEWRNTR